jgi:beta-lactamase superfamily II metal-dependent hydrolase
VVTPSGQGGVEIAESGSPRLTVLSPTPERLQALWGVWDKELEKLRRKERDEADVEAKRGATRGRLDLEELARRSTALDRAVPNGSSIAILLEHQGASVLLSGDAFPDVLVPELLALARKRGQPAGSPLAVDVLKLSHHGSRANVTTDLLKAVQAKHYVVSTSNAYFKHPNAEALARVITAGQHPVLWFNYDTPQNRQWADPGLMQRYAYEVRYPANGELGEDEGVVITLPRTKTQGIRTSQQLPS